MPSELLSRQPSGRQLLILADHAVPGPKRKNPQADKANQITKQLCQKYRIDLPNIDEYNTMAAHVFPHAPVDRLVAITLWLDFLYFIDDLYDRNITHLYSHDAEKYQHILENTLRIICDRDKPKTDHPFYPVAYELNRRFSEIAMPGWFERFKAASMKHLRSVTYDAEHAVDDSGTLSVEKYIALREADCAMESMISTIDIALGVYTPDAVLNHPKIQRLVRLATRFGGFSNELFSYEKEVLRLGSRFNLVAVFMEAHELSFAEAVHETILLINRETAEFLELEKNLPVWDDPHLNELARLYASALKDQIVAAYHWQFTTNRYRSPHSPFPELRQML
ncbi:MAG: hypothetical protein AAFW84_25225 [Cyanobacteria bacterium J06635_15]